MSAVLATVAPLAVLTAALNVPLGRLRANAGRRSHRRFGLLAASAFLALALRHSFGLSWGDALPIFVAMLAGRWAGLAMGCDITPTPARWRTAAYCSIIAGLLLFAVPPVQAQSGQDWKRLDAVEPAPTFRLTNQDGKPVALSDFRGKAVVLTFLYTECKDVCPVLPQIIGRADQALTAKEKEQVCFIGVSIDPRRDTPQKLRAFMHSHSLSPERWTLLTGSLKEASQVADDYGIVAKPDLHGDLVHNAVYVLIDPQGQLRTEFHGLFTPTQEIVAALRVLLAPKKLNKGKA